VTAAAAVGISTDGAIAGPITGIVLIAMAGISPTITGNGIARITGTGVIMNTGGIITTAVIGADSCR
jgi:hypothetical protein